MALKQSFIFFSFKMSSLYPSNYYLWRLRKNEGLVNYLKKKISSRRPILTINEEAEGN